MSTRNQASWMWVRLLAPPLVALVAVLPLVVHGCSCGHDFDFHILSWMEAATQFLHGNLHPAWAYTPAFNAGEPRFVFYPPLSWTLGALLGILLPWTVTPIAYTWLALTAAGFGCYRLLRDFAPPGNACLVATLYIVNPYMLFTAYERTAYAELLAAAWLPLLLHAAFRKRVTVHGIAIPVALLWLTNAPAAVIGCYSLAILTVARLLTRRMEPEANPGSPLRLAANTLGGTALGLALGAFYILPAAYERRYVQIGMAMTNGMRITDNYLFHHTADPDHDAVLHTASLLAIGLLGALCLAVGAAFARHRRRRLPGSGILILIAVLGSTIGFLLTPASGPIWRLAPELAFLQFPWRFLALLTPLLALALALALRGLQLRYAHVIAGSLILTTGLTIAGYRAFHQECDPEDTVAARFALFHSPAGTEPTDEYTPLTADNDSLTKNNPSFWLATDPASTAPPGTPSGPIRWPLDLVAPTPETLILNLRDYPAWRITVNHVVTTTRLPRADGLIAIPLTGGRSHLEAAYSRTADGTAGWIISLGSLVSLCVLARRNRLSR